MVTEILVFGDALKLEFFGDAKIVHRGNPITVRYPKSNCLGQGYEKVQMTANTKIEYQVSGTLNFNGVPYPKKWVKLRKKNIVISQGESISILVRKVGHEEELGIVIHS